MSTGQPRPAIEAEAEREMDELEDAERPDEPDDPDDPFDSVDDADIDLADVDVGRPVSERDSTGDAESDSASGFDGIEEGDELFEPEPDETAGEAVADILNEGAARLAVVGLEDEFEVNGRRQTKKDLEEEFVEVFETFRLGHYGAECAEEYVFKEDEEIPPAYGFAASMILCTALVVWMRPDGTELAGGVAEKLQGIQQ